VAKTTSIPSYVLPLSKARIASARILSTTVVLEGFAERYEPATAAGVSPAKEDEGERADAAFIREWISKQG
jgi:hypothetical protein